MAWVRIHDDALSHPKLLPLFNARDPLHLWMWGLTYAQRHLTDGAISDEILPKNARKAADILVARGLWIRQESGYFIHDFLDWNDSKEAVRAKQELAKHRQKRWYDKAADGSARRVPNASPNASHQRVTNGVPNGEPNQTKPNQYPNPTDSGAPTRPTRYGRIDLHRWQLDALIASLGPHAADFDLDAWVLNLSALADAQGLVIDKRTLWPWVQSQLREEVGRRGLAVATPVDTADRFGKQTSRLLQAVANIAAQEV